MKNFRGKVGGKMIAYYDEEFDDANLSESISICTLEEITKADSDAELMAIANWEWKMGNRLMAIKSAYRAAANGYAKAQTFLGERYELGDAVEKDDAEAVKWYTKAALQMDVKALSCLACYYHLGKVVKKDKVLAEAMFLTSSKLYLKSWYNVDVNKDESYCYHNSLEDAYQTIEQFIESNK